MRWLHLTDIHMGRPGPTEQNVALGELLRALPAVLAGNPVDAILITGDIARAGDAAQYDEFTRSVLLPLRAMPECVTAQLIAVPGNHDLFHDDSSLPIAWDSLGSKRQSRFFEESSEGVRTRAMRAAHLRPSHGSRGRSPHDEYVRGARKAVTALTVPRFAGFGPWPVRKISKRPQRGLDSRSVAQRASWDLGTSGGGSPRGSTGSGEYHERGLPGSGRLARNACSSWAPSLTLTPRCPLDRAGYRADPPYQGRPDGDAFPDPVGAWRSQVTGSLRLAVAHPARPLPAPCK